MGSKVRKRPSSAENKLDVKEQRLRMVRAQIIDQLSRLQIEEVYMLQAFEREG